MSKKNHNNREIRRLFCRSGGGLPGLDIHAGIWLALAERGITSTANAGTSAGAIIAALDSIGVTAEKAQYILTNLSDSDIRAPRPFWRIRSLLGMDHFMDPAPFEKTLDRVFPARIATRSVAGGPAPVTPSKPCAISATRESDANPVTMRLHPGNLHESLLASCAIPGVWPKRKIGGECYSDGGTTAYLPLPDNFLDYDEIYLLVANPPLSYKPTRESAFSRMFLAASILMQNQIDRTIALAYARAADHARRNILNGSACKIILIRPTCGQDAGSLHFRHDLIAEARFQAARQLDNQLSTSKGPPQ